jgi:hypothetical protein
MGEDVLARSETMYNKTDAVVTATHFKENTRPTSSRSFGPGNPSTPFTWHSTRVGRIVVASTDMYSLYGGADQAKEYVRLNLANAPIVDLTVNTGSRW